MSVSATPRSRSISRQVGAEPAPVTHLDGVAEAARAESFRKSSSTPMPSTVKEGGSCRRSGPSRSPRSAIVRTKFSASTLAADEVLFVRDLLRKLGGEEEAVGRDLAPPPHGRAAGSTVEGRVYLHGGVVLDVLGEPATPKGALRDRASPPSPRKTSPRYRGTGAPPAARCCRGSPRRAAVARNRPSALQRGDATTASPGGFMKAIPVYPRRVYYICAVDERRPTP